MAPWMPVVVAFLCGATMGQARNSVIVAVGAVLIGILNMYIEYFHEPSQYGGAVFITDCTGAIGFDAAVAIAAHKLENGNQAYHVYAGVNNKDDFKLFESMESITPVTLNMSDIYSMAIAHRTIAMDLPHHENAQRMVAVINTAMSRGPVHPVELGRPEDFRKVMDINFVGPAFLFRKWIPSVRHHRGRLINVGSIFGSTSLPLGQPHAGSMHAMESFIDSARLELWDKKVSVSQVSVGWFRSNPPERGFHKFFTRSKEPAWADDYRNVYDAAVRATRVGSGPGGAEDDPGVEVVTDAIMHALTDKHPKTRYVVGKVAGPKILGWQVPPLPAAFLGWARWGMADRLLDKMLMSMA